VQCGARGEHRESVLPNTKILEKKFYGEPEVWKMIMHFIPPASFENIFFFFFKRSENISKNSYKNKTTSRDRLTANSKDIYYRRFYVIVWSDLQDL
jgi:hypothetical protein